MKRIILILIAFASSFCHAQNSNETMKQTIRQEGWIQGLFNAADTVGIPVEVVDFKHPQPNMHQCSIILQSSPEVESALKRHSSAKSVLPRLSIVVRTDKKSKLDEAYHMANARIVSVKPSKKHKETMEATISFNNVSKVSAKYLNPGPPPGAPTVKDIGMNMGWICNESADRVVTRTEVEIAGFTPPFFNGQLSVTFGKPVPGMQRLIQADEPLQELILVLPDRDLHRYVEYKLWDVAAIVDPNDGHQIIFKSEMIECLTGGGTSN